MWCKPVKQRKAPAFEYQEAKEVIRFLFCMSYAWKPGIVTTQLVAKEVCKIGLGLFEYMLLAEELNAEPVYVVNNGISHAESTPLGRIAPFLKETLDAVEFITGPATSHWGSQRAAMGRTEPWKLNFLAIGNEVCLSGS